MLDILHSSEGLEDLADVCNALSLGLKMNEVDKILLLNRAAFLPWEFMGIDLFMVFWYTFIIFYPNIYSLTNKLAQRASANANAVKETFLDSYKSHLESLKNHQVHHSLLFFVSVALNGTE